VIAVSRVKRCGKFLNFKYTYLPWNAMRRRTAAGRDDRKEDLR